jgi:DnaJ-domain-containing protein 1
MFQKPSSFEYDFASSAFEDEDYSSAWDELNDFLGGGTSRSEDSWERRFRGEEPAGERSAGSGGTRTRRGYRSPPEKLRRDYERLGVPFGAPFEEVRAAYKDLIRKHHPDRHARDPEAYARATHRAQGINESLQRIKAWEIAKRGG